MSITHEQVDKILAFVDANPAAAPENKSVLALDIASLQENFNAGMQTSLNTCNFDDAAETIEIVTKLFLIKEPQIFTSEAGKLFMNMFGDRTAIFGVSDNDDRFKLLTCVYTTPEDTDENTLSSMVLNYFVKTLLPNVDAESFLRELSTTGQKIVGGVNFSIAADGNLIFVTAVAE